MTKVLLVTLALVSVPACCMGRGRTTSTDTIVISGPGFSPDPTTSSAQAGGTMEASALADGCVGSIPSAPQHTLRLGAALPLLRVLVHSTEDTTLVVRAPDGTFHCNDDSGDPTNGLNPVVEIYGAASGEYSVYVGAYGERAMLTPYSIGFTATPGTFPSQVVR